MSDWIVRYAPDLIDDIENGKLKVKAAYDRLKPLYDRTILSAVRHAREHDLDPEQIEIVRTADGFMFLVR